MNEDKPKNQEKQETKEPLTGENDGIPFETMQKGYEFIPNALCQYKQRGFYLVCVSCEIQHATFIGSGRMMIGESEDGKPILKDRDLKVA